VGRFGQSGDKDRETKNVECWTNGKGPEIYQPCKDKTCVKDKPALREKLCEEFEEQKKTEELFKGKVQLTKGEETVVCYPGNAENNGIGKYGWCEVKKPRKGEPWSNTLTEERWGFCSHHCNIKGTRHDEFMMETQPRIFKKEICDTFPILKRSKYMQEREICGGNDVTPKQKVVSYKHDGQKFVREENETKKPEGRLIGGADTCQGDSGGPLIKWQQLRGANNILKHKAYLIGLVSRGSGCAYFGKPGIYTRVKYWLPWIKENMGGEAVCGENP